MKRERGAALTLQKCGEGGVTERVRGKVFRGVMKDVMSANKGRRRMESQVGAQGVSQVFDWKLKKYDLKSALTTSNKRYFRKVNTNLVALYYPERGQLTIDGLCFVY